MFAVNKEQVSAVSADNAETSENCIGTLELANTNGLLSGELQHTEGVVNVSSPIPQFKEDLSTTTIVVATEPSSEKVDKGILVRGYVDTKLRNSFFKELFNGCSWWHKRSLEAGFGTYILQRPEKRYLLYFDILYETHIKQEQIHQIIYN